MHGTTRCSSLTPLQARLRAFLRQTLSVKTYCALHKIPGWISRHHIKCLSETICHYSTCVVPSTVEVVSFVSNLPKAVEKGSVIGSFIFFNWWRVCNVPWGFLKCSICRWTWLLQCQVVQSLMSGMAPDSLTPGSSWQERGRSPGVIHSSWEELSILVWNCWATCPACPRGGILIYC